MLKVNFFEGRRGREADGFIEVEHKMSYYTPHVKSCFSKNLHVIWPGELFKVGSFFLKHPGICFHA